MVCHLHLPPHGMASLRAGSHSRLRPIAVEYKTDLDHRISFLGEGWKNFLEATNLQIGQAVLITVRTMRTHVGQQVFVFDIIKDLVNYSSSDSDSDSEEY